MTGGPGVCFISLSLRFLSSKLGALEICPLSIRKGCEVMVKSCRKQISVHLPEMGCPEREEVPSVKV